MSFFFFFFTKYNLSFYFWRGYISLSLFQVLLFLVIIQVWLSLDFNLVFLRIGYFQLRYYFLLTPHSYLMTLQYRLMKMFDLNNHVNFIQKKSCISDLTHTHVYVSHSLAYLIQRLYEHVIFVSINFDG